jgi:predicted deacylase
MGPPNPVDLKPVDIAAWAAGNTGIPYATTLASNQPGPHVVITALTHGNELCGAHALKFLFEQQIRPRRGALTLAFANVAAYLQFDAEHPIASRYLDEDLNRVWSPSVLDGPRQSRELQRARELRPLIEDTDFLLDIHSMQSSSPPLILCGTQAKGRGLAAAVGYPAFVVADAGHAAGPRMRDYGAFADEARPQTALLVECGQHWQTAARMIAIETALRFLLAVDVVAPELVRPHLQAGPPAPQRHIRVTEAVAITNETFAFVEEYVGLEVIPKQGTVIGYDGADPVRTPYDDCILIMPTRRLSRGQTAVRFGHFFD